MMTKRDKIRLEAKRTNDNEMKRKYKKLRNEKNWFVQKKKKEYFKKKFTTSTESKSLWKVYEELNGKIKSSMTTNIPYIQT